MTKKNTCRVNRGLMRAQRNSHALTVDLPIERLARVQISHSAPYFPGAYGRILEVAYQHGGKVLRVMLEKNRNITRVPLTDCNVIKGVSWS